MAKKKSNRPDEAHGMTDAELADLERRVAEIYKEARDSLDATIRDYFAKLEERDAKMKKLIGTVQNGKVWTEQDYKLWRLNQIARGKRFEALRDKIAERYTDANETASAYVNDATPGIYSLNRNYAAYTIDKATGGALTVGPDGETLNADFILFDEQTVKRLTVEQPDVMPYYPPKRAVQRGIDLEYGKSQITKQVTSGALQGLGVGKIADSLQERMETMSRTSALRAARTGVTAAQNAGRMDGFHAAQEMGIRVKKQWLATLDGRTRHEHQILDGQVQEIDSPFEVNGQKIRYPGDPSAAPRLAYNCRCTLVTDLPQNLNAGQRRARDPVTGESVVIDYTTYEDWMKSLKAEHGEKAVDNALKKIHNESADREQHKTYRKRLGKIIPKDFKDFQALKYENPDEWERIKKSYRNHDPATGTRIDWIRQKSHDERIQYFGGGDAGEQRLALLDSGVITNDAELERLYKRNDKGVRVRKTLQELADDGIMTVGEKALEHSVNGEYIAPSKAYPNGRMKSGGHSQKAMDIMDQMGIQYHVVKTYSNGVRIGYVDGHESKLKNGITDTMTYPSGKPGKKNADIGQSWFPSSWTDYDIRCAGTFVANKGNSSGLQKFATFRGVMVGIYTDVNGQPATIFPENMEQPTADGGIERARS